MEIIDSHAHIYPQKIAKKATQTIGQFYDIEMEMSEGTAEQLIADGSKIGVSKYIVHSVATNTHQVHAINEFIKRECDLHPEFIPFMTLHQDLDEKEIEEEVDWCVKNGFKGVKLHPDFQKFNIDDEGVKKIYRVVADRLPILFHVGDDRYDYSKPTRLANVAKEFPNVKFIAAHFGGYRCWHEVEVYVKLENVYFDTCSSLPFITPQKAKELIELLGEDRFFFATDFPMWDAKEELERFNKIDLTELQREKILSKNLKKLLNL